MRKNTFFSREDYNSLPLFLRARICKLGTRLNKAIDERDRIGNELFSRKYLEIIKALLFNMLEHPDEFSDAMVVSIGATPSIEGLRLSPKYKAAVSNLINANISEDRQFLIESVLDKIAEALEE